MKFFFLFLAFLTALPVSFSAETECPGGVCPLPESFLSQEALPPSAVAVESHQPVRKAEGWMDETEFLRFLGGTPPRNPWLDAGPFWFCLLTILAGIALNLTPCVLPMIPVNLLIIGAGDGGKKGAWRGMCYGFGMAAAYGILGLLAAFAGIGFGTLNSNPYFQLAAGVIFLILALAMTGVLPLSFFSRFHVDVRKFAGGSAAAVFLLGVFAALMAGACVSPVVAAVLLFTAATFQTGNLWVVFLPFLLGIGMALPWPFAAMGLSFLPKPGRKMAIVKTLLALLVAGMGICFCFTGIRSLLPSGRSLRSAEESFAALRSGMALSQKENRSLLVAFHASWCKNCLAMEARTLRSPEVRAVMERDFVFVSFAAEDPSDPAVRRLLDAWEISGFPAFVILQP